MDRTRFPGVIDHAHGAMIAPKDDNYYINRKGYHSKNIQLICDYNLKILNINAQYAGATHDIHCTIAFVSIQEELEFCYHNGDTNSWLLIDSAYPQQPWLMTPVLNVHQTYPEDRYNQRHSSACNCVKRCYGVLKSRFRCLSNKRQLRCNPQYLGKIATVCAVLHNICIVGDELWENIIPNEPEDAANIIPDGGPINILNAGRATRNRIIEQYFR